MFLSSMRKLFEMKISKNDDKRAFSKKVVSPFQCSGNINFPNCYDGENKNVVMLIHGRVDFYLTCNSNESHGNRETCKCRRSLTYFQAIKGHVDIYFDF